MPSLDAAFVPFKPKSGILAPEQRPPLAGGPKLHVFLPRQKEADFIVFANRVKDIMEKSKEAADRAGRSVPAAILFPENSLEYCFDIETSEVMKCLDRVQPLIPADNSVVIAFSVLEKSRDGPRNIGYLVNNARVERSMKRVCTNYDAYQLRRAFPIGEVEHHEAIWGAQGDEMMDIGVSFPKFDLPGGLSVEIRVCLDVASGPIRAQADVITLVPAYALNPRCTSILSPNRKSVFIHDGRDGAPWFQDMPSNTIYAARMPPNAWKKAFLAGEICASSFD